MEGNPWGYGQAYTGRATRHSPPPAHGDVSRFDLSLLDQASFNAGPFSAATTHPAFGSRAFTTLPQMNYALPTLPPSLPQFLDPMSSITQGFAYPYKTGFPGIDTTHHTLEHMLPQAKYVPSSTISFTSPSKPDYTQTRDHTGVVHDLHSTLMDPAKGWSLSNFLPSQTAPFSNIPTDMSDILMAGMVPRSAAERPRAPQRVPSSSPQKYVVFDGRTSRTPSSSYQTVTSPHRITPTRHSPSHSQKTFLQTHQQQSPEILSSSRPSEQYRHATDFMKQQPPPSRNQIESMMTQMDLIRNQSDPLRTPSQSTRNPSQIRRQSGSTIQHPDTLRQQQETLRHPAETQRHQEHIMQTDAVRLQGESLRHSQDSMRSSTESLRHQPHSVRHQEPYRHLAPESAKHQTHHKSGQLTSPQMTSVMTSHNQAELRIPSRPLVPEVSPVPSQPGKVEQYSNISFQPDLKGSYRPEMMSYGTDCSTKNLLKKAIMAESVSSPPQDLSLKSNAVHQQSLQQQPQQQSLQQQPQQQSLQQPQQQYVGISQLITTETPPQQLPPFFNTISESTVYPVKSEPTQVYPNMQLTSNMDYDPISPISDTPHTDSYSTLNIEDLSSSVVQPQSIDARLVNVPQTLPPENKVIQDLSTSYAVHHQAFNKSPSSYPPSLSHISNVPQGSIPITAPSIPAAPLPIQAVADSTTKTKKRSRKKKLTAEERQEAQIKALFDDDGYKPNLMTDDFLDQIQQQNAITDVVPQIITPDDLEKKKKKKRKKNKEEDIMTSPELSNLPQSQLYQNSSVLSHAHINSQFPHPEARLNTMNTHPEARLNTINTQQMQQQQETPFPLHSPEFGNSNCGYRQNNLITNDALMSPHTQMNTSSTFMDQQKHMHMQTGYVSNQIPGIQGNQMYPGSTYNPGQMAPGIAPHATLPLDQFGNPISQEYIGMMPPNMSYLPHPNSMMGQGMDAFGEQRILTKVEPKELPKAVTAQPEFDDEFQHLTTPPKVPVYTDNGIITNSAVCPKKHTATRKRRNNEDIEQAPAHTIILPDPLKPLPKAKTVFENSFLSFIQGNRGETLASLIDTSSRKVLPKHKVVTGLAKKIITPESPAWIEMSPEHENVGDWWGFSDDDKPKKATESSSSKSPHDTTGMNKSIPHKSAINKLTSKSSNSGLSNSKSTLGNYVSPGKKNSQSLTKKRKLLEKDTKVLKTNDKKADTPRIQTSRKAKEVAKTKTTKKKKKYSGASSEASGQSTQDLSDERGYDSDDDPAWTPSVDQQGDENEKTRRFKNRPLPRSKHSSHPMGHMPQTIKSFNEAMSARRHEEVLGDPEIEEEGVEHVKVKTAAKPVDVYKVGRFLIEDSDKVNYDNYPVWRISDAKMLQKYEFTIESGKCFHQSTYTYSSWVPATMMSHFTAIEVKDINMGKRHRVLVLEEYQPKPPTDGSLEEAYEDHPLVEMFNVYMQIFLSQALEPTFLSAIQDANDEFYLHPLNRIDALIDMRVEQIGVKVNWKCKFKVALDERPLLRELERPNLQQPCQACHNSQETAIKSVHLYGAVYDRYTLETVTTGAPHASSQEFMVGRLAGSHLGMYHKLRHYKHHLLQRCSAKVKLLRERNENLDNPEILDKALQNRAWVLKLFEEIKKLLDVT